MRFTPDGATLITSAWDNSTRVWSVSQLPGPFRDESNSSRPSATFKVWEDWAFWCAFAPKLGGDKLAAVHVMGECRVWDIKDWTSISFQACITTLPHHLDGMCQDSLHFTPDGKGCVVCVTRKRQPLIGFYRTQDYGLRGTFEPGSPSGRDLPSGTPEFGSRMTA